MIMGFGACPYAVNGVRGMDQIGDKQICIKTERCTKQYVLIVIRNAKCHSSQQKEDQYIAGIATRSTDHLEETDIDLRLNSHSEAIDN